MNYKDHFYLVLVVMFCVSCSPSKGDGSVIRDSNGAINEVIVVMPDDLWQGAVGTTLRKIVSEPLVGLPQPESHYDLIHVSPKNFKSMLNAVRSIIYIKNNATASYSVKQNVFAKPQVVSYIEGNSSEAIINQIKLNKESLLSVFKNQDLKVIQNRIRGGLMRREFKTVTKLGIELSIPKTYNLVDDTGDFLWLRHRMQKGRTMELLVYEIPNYNRIISEFQNEIITIRDSIGQKYIPGGKEGSFMITEKAYTPFHSMVQIDNKPAIETRGKWEVKNDFMAGPFLNYAIKDSLNSRMIIVEGFVFAPAVDKRDYLFDLEAILKTITITNKK